MGIAGFYAVMMDPESRPYTAFYVEGRGYFRYLRMPFGLTGAPSTFGTVTADNMFDLLVKEIMELFVDDGGTALDTFKDMMTKLTKISPGFAKETYHFQQVSASFS